MKIIKILNKTNKIRKKKKENDLKNKELKLIQGKNNGMKVNKTLSDNEESFKYSERRNINKI